ncbi:hypothetical protein HLB23_09110 [Nocardia uniformis]|uniref:Uncharacterized protein n=1 Tax=Nocardia uniformis TaxID=53432 RepID=A0A849C4Y9_9NOCA|nr:hypothetical protein [Nocardia uniformis]NNH70019.1 hypothetical protein [Nocardia uniformis]
MTTDRFPRAGRTLQVHTTSEASRSWDDPVGPFPPRLHRLSYVLAVNATGCSEYHEVTLISIVAYTDGFTVSLRVRYPVGEGATPKPGPSQVTLGYVHAIAVEATDDLGNEYRCTPVLGGGAGPGGNWQAYGEVHCDPVIAPDATTITVRVLLPPGHTDQAIPAQGTVPLMPVLGEIPAAAGARLTDSPAFDGPAADRGLRPVAAADLLSSAELLEVSAVARKARAYGVTLTVLSMERYDQGLHLRLIVALDDDHPDVIARLAAPVAEDQLPWILNADHLHLTDDLGNRYPLTTMDVAGERAHRTVSVTSPLPVPPDTVGFRLDAREIVWCGPRSDGAMHGGERIVADPGPFTVMFPRYPVHPV